MGGAGDQAHSLYFLAHSHRLNDQLDEAEEAAIRALTLLPEKGQEFRVGQFHRLLGNVYQVKGEKEKSVMHYEIALQIASDFEFHELLFWINHDLVEAFLDDGKFDDAHAHVNQALLHSSNSTLDQGRAILLQARAWYRQHRLEEATSGVLRALEVFERLGAAKHVAKCENLLRIIEQASKGPSPSVDSVPETPQEP